MGGGSDRGSAPGEGLEDIDLGALRDRVLELGALAVDKDHHVLANLALVIQDVSPQPWVSSNTPRRTWSTVEPGASVVGTSRWRRRLLVKTTRGMAPSLTLRPGGFKCRNTWPGSVPSESPPIGLVMNHRLAHVISGLLVLLTLNACGGAKPVPRSAAPQGVFVRGADISHLQKSEDNGAVYRDAQGEADPLVLLRRHGVTWARLRLWVRPEEPYSNLASVAAMAVRLRDAGMPWLLDIHYSDTWADPGNQFKPGFWSDMSYFPLEKQVRSYTADVIRTLREQGTPPDLVQPGNEIMQGFLWPEGRVGEL